MEDYTHSTVAMEGNLHILAVRDSCTTHDSMSCSSHISRLRQLSEQSIFFFQTKISRQLVPSFLKMKISIYRTR